MQANRRTAHFHHYKSAYFLIMIQVSNLVNVVKPFNLIHGVIFKVKKGTFIIYYLLVYNFIIVILMVRLYFYCFYFYIIMIKVLKYPVLSIN